MTDSCSKNMVSLMTLSILLFVHQSSGSEYLDKLLKTHPTWSFELVSVESLVDDRMARLKAADFNVTEDVLREKIAGHFGPETTHIARKVGDPKWSRNPPRFFDAREEWKECAKLINEIDDEGACFADGPVVAASVASDRYCIFTNGTFKEKLSAEMLTGCAELCTRGSYIFISIIYTTKFGIPTGGSYKSNKGCLPHKVHACRHSKESYLEGNKEKSRRNESEPGELKPCEDMMAYDRECPTKCSNHKYSKTLDEDLVRFKHWYWMWLDEFQIRTEILAYGPVATSILLYDDLFQYPEKGMYRKQEGAEFVIWNKNIKLIGWGEEEGTKYWLAVNTWDQWGSTKVFKIPRGIDYIWVEAVVEAAVFED